MWANLAHYITLLVSQNRACAHVSACESLSPRPPRTLREPMAIGTKTSLCACECVRISITATSENPPRTNGDWHENQLVRMPAPSHGSKSHQIITKTRSCACLRRHRKTEVAQSAACAHTRACGAGLTIMKHTLLRMPAPRDENGRCPKRCMRAHARMPCSRAVRGRSAGDPRAIRGRSAAGQIPRSDSGRFARLRARCKFAEASNGKLTFRSKARK